MKTVEETVELSVNLYAVELELKIDGYEKSSTIWVLAENKGDAEYLALCAETHNEPLSRESFNEGVEWLDDGMRYRVYSCTLIPSEIASKLRTLPFIRPYDNPA